MEFRIKLLLYNFFVDYRKMCYIYINGDIKVVQDLIDYISKKFGITTDLYLTLNDSYLPHFEDIRILCKDDIVIVHPFCNTTQSALAVLSVKPKKSKDKKECKEINNCTSIQDQERPKKNKVHIEEEMVVDNYDDYGQDCVDSSQISSEGKKKKKRKSKVVEESGDLNLSEQLVKVETDKPIRVGEAVIMEFNKKKRIELLPISTIPKIVKPIIVYDNVPKSNVVPEKINDDDSSKQTNTSDVENGTPETINNSNVNNEYSFNKSDNQDDNLFKFLVPSESVTNKNVLKFQKVPPNNENCSDYLNVSQTDLSSEFEGSEASQVVKRKRKRVRKHKSKIIVPQLPQTFHITPTSSVPDSPQHIRFDGNTDDVNVRANNDENQTYCNGDNKSDSEKEIIQIDGYKSENSQVNYEDLCDKEIVRFPIMTHVVPNKGDVIAFKRYMLSADYTPEISNYIIGRVCKYSHDTCNVIIKILEGKDQCSNPQGKFYIEENEEAVQMDEMELQWSELIEPRLLFP